MSPHEVLPIPQANVPLSNAWGQVVNAETETRSAHDVDARTNLPFSWDKDVLLTSHMK